MSEEQQPVVRITTFGPLSVECLEDNSERYTPVSADKIDAKGVLPARSLLKLLLCQPHRYAPRDWVLEQFWPDMEYKAALHRVGNVVWILRRMLCPPEAKDSEKLRSLLLTSTQSEQSTGLGYQLAAYPLIWVDADAFEWNVEQAARAARFGDDPLPLWQRAYALGERGTFLQDEIYSDWTARRRHLLDGHFRQCVFEVSRLLIARGLSTEAEVCLRKYVVAHPTDEDVLRSLMDLLGEQERYQELLGYYETCATALADEDRQPDSRTQDMAEYFKSKQIRRTTAVPHQALSASTPSARHLPPSQLLDIKNTQSLPFAGSLGPLPETQDGSFLPRRTREVEALDMTQSRRQALHELLSNACVVLLLSPYAIEPQRVGLDFSVLDDLERITASYWRLCQNASIDLLGNVTEHLRVITHQFKQKWPYDGTQRLCQLAGEAAQILGKTLFDVHEYSLAWSYYTFSLKAAQAAGNHDLWAVGLGRMSLLLIYWKQSQAALPLLQEARQLTIQSTRIACWLAAVEAEVHAQLDDADACDQALQEARGLLTSESLGEDRYATGMNPSRLAGYEGACFVRLRQPERALPALKQAALLLDAQAVRRHSTILSDMSMAYAQQGNIHEACQSALQALTLTMQTKSLSVHSRVRLVREALEPWKETESVQALEKRLDTALAYITA